MIMFHLRHEIAMAKLSLRRSIKTSVTSYDSSYPDESRHANYAPLPTKSGSILNLTVKCLCGLLLTVLALAAFSASAHTWQAHSLCAANEEVVFSCALQGSKKTVSLCAPTHDGLENRHFRYVLGKPSDIEFFFSTQNSKDRAFLRSHWLYATTFGQAYSFVKNGYKYIIVSVEDSVDQRGRSSLIVQRAGEPHAAHEMNCNPSTVIKTKKESVLQRINDWPIDTDIEGSGPPSTR